jgi:hypothetical protein
MKIYDYGSRSNVFENVIQLKMNVFISYIFFVEIYTYTTSVITKKL